MISHRTALLFIAAAMTSFATAQEIRVPRLVPPKPDRKQPAMQAFVPPSRNRDALVHVKFRVDEAGKVASVELQEGGFHDEQYEAAALKLVAGLRFSPATLDGSPVEYQSVMVIRFQNTGVRSSDNKGATLEFRAEARKVSQLIEEKDFAGAHFHAQWMLSEKVKTGFDYAVLQSTLAFTHYKAGNVHRALAASRQVTASTGIGLETYRPGGRLPKVSLRDFLLNKDLLDQMLQMRFVLDASQGFYLDALLAQGYRRALRMARDDDAYAQDAARMLTALQSAASIRGHARLDEALTWDHELWFNRFTLQSLRGGAIDRIQLDCDGYSRVLSFTEGSEWTIPPQWGNCRLQVTGTLGAEFDIVEYRDAPDSAQAATAN